MAHMVSSAGLSVVLLTRATYLELIGNFSSRQAAFLVRTPPLHVFEHSLHSVVFHLYSITGLDKTQRIILSTGQATVFTTIEKRIVTSALVFGCFIIGS